jgi:hypothetical protein
MIVKINETQEILFRGDYDTAKKIYNNGKYTKYVENAVQTDSMNLENYTLSLVYEMCYQDQSQYLYDTDWMVIRENETSKIAPEDIKLKRQEARLFLSSFQI